jgi:hypothetical protein
VRVSRRLFRIALVLALSFLPSLATAQSGPSAANPSNENAAASALGPQWKQLARKAGLIFAGTVLSAGTPPVCINDRDGACPVSPATTTNQGAVPHANPASLDSSATNPNLHSNANVVELQFRVDQPIAGAEPGQTLVIHEWLGTLDRQPQLHPGDRVLLFLYPPSRLGLTSPVAGPQGQIRLDSTGRHVDRSAPIADMNPHNHGPQNSSPSRPITVTQLARAIRAARGE